MSDAADRTADPAAILDETGTGFWRAVSQHGAPVTAYGIPGRKEGDFVCTQDPGHAGSHAACDGEGRILARWPRSPAGRYWQHGDCEGHDHG